MDIVVIAGKRLPDDGSLSAELEQRLKCGLAVFRETGAQLLCVTGGMANRKAGRTEAEAMVRWLLGAGVEESAILAEDRSLTTFGNAFYLRRLLRGREVERIYLVSTDYHFTRTPKFLQIQRIFGRAFPKCEILCIAAKPSPRGEGGTA